LAKKSKPGFTLVELMAVLIIIGVVCAIAVPGIVEVRYRNILADTVNNVQVAAIQARSLALQTRRAAVLEVREDKVWVNLLQGCGCDTPVDTGCISNTGIAGNGEVLLYDRVAGVGTSFAEEAGVGMCLGGARTLPDISGNNDSLTGGTCPTDPLVMESVDDDGFALCYTGRGELYVRAVKDVASECPIPDAGTGGGLTWLRTCSASDTAAVVDGDLKLYDGAVIVFNRYESAHCKGNKKDVRRALFFPTTGSPYSGVAP
jgi:prepilin-type N-terminal cleavage/methylation domain-containing protein